jgi:hypothetical protein
MKAQKGSRDLALLFLYSRHYMSGCLAIYLVTLYIPRAVTANSTFSAVQILY